jgi:hypothetical protein
VLAATAAVTVATAAVATVTAVLSPDPVSSEAVLIALSVLALATVGSVLAIRVPANAIGLLLIVSALALGVETLAQAYAQRSLTLAGGSWPGTALAAWLYTNLLSVPVLIMTVGIPVIFPDGHLLSPRWRWLVVAVLVSWAGEFLRYGFAPELIPDTNLKNPFHIAGIAPLLSAIDGSYFIGVIFVAAIASVAIRFRRGSIVERQQLKWLMAVTAFAAVAWIVVITGGVTGSPVLLGIGWSSGLLAFTGFPLAIGIAVLRYRLYEIDRIISRTIAWALVTGVLVAVFFGVVVALQAVLTDFTQGETIAVAASTLAAAVLFQPLRRRVQRAVDRRFDRATYDAQRTIDAFAVRLRDEVDLDAVVADLQATVAASIKPTSFALWLRPAPAQSRSRS